MVVVFESNLDSGYLFNNRVVLVAGAVDDEEGTVDDVGGGGRGCGYQKGVGIDHQRHLATPP